MSNQPPKDFLALSHGHEWVNFYESFDKLVQDHLTRSSELLRKAMALPEVADREVAQIRDDLETRMTTERERTTATLTSLKQDIANTQHQATSVVRMVASLIGDLDRLSTGVDSALTQVAADAHVPMPNTDAVGDAIEQHMEGTADVVAQSATIASPDSSAAVVEPMTNEVSAPDESSDEDASDDSEIDLNALAAMEAELTTEPEASSEADESSSDSGSDGNGATSASDSAASRPHWLSMARNSNSL